MDAPLVPITISSAIRSSAIRCVEIQNNLDGETKDNDSNYSNNFHS